MKPAPTDTTPKNAPFFDSQLIAKKSASIRAINREYYTELTAKTTTAIAIMQAEQLRMQADSSAETLKLLGEMSESQLAANTLLESVDGGIDELVGLTKQMVSYLESIEDSLNRGFGQIEGTLREINDTLSEINDTLIVGFNRTVMAICEQTQVLSAISHTLSTPYETKARELLREGQRWLEAGAESKGTEKEENWRDALRLFRAVFENDIGRQNYVAWFNAGYLEWNLLNDPATAEKSFSNAQRYSAPARDPWHTKSLRHMAEMQYLQERYTEARDTALKAVGVKREYETLYNLARYHAKLGNRVEMLKLLDECITLRPETVGIIFSEADFLA